MSAAATAPAGVSAGLERGLDRLDALFGLSPFEREVVSLCAAVELGEAPPDGGGGDGGRPTFGQALTALAEPHWSAVSPAGPLRHWRLVRLVGEGPLAARTLRLDERVLNLLVGVDHLDRELEGTVVELTPPDELAPSHERTAGRIAEALDSARRLGEWPALQLTGGESHAKREIAARGAADAGLRLLALDAAALPRDRRNGAELARLCAREAALAGAALLIEAADFDADPGTRESLRRFVDEFQGAALIAAPEAVAGIATTARMEVEAVPAAERETLLREVLGPPGDGLNGSLGSLAGQFELDPAALRAAAAEALLGSEARLEDRLWDACRSRARPEVDDIARRIEPGASWGDIVLPPDRLRALEEIVSQVRQRTRVHEQWGFGRRKSRGLGIGALFSGPSGTGKTMAAEMLAAELRLEIYRVDISAVVSKYIGETSKSLRRVFDAAEKGGAVLLFDEADALFGKRTEVKESNDRFANIEVGYLLQRMEEYRGLAILTTNQRRAVDEAFLRRLRFVVDFPFPDRAQREEIWRRAFPAATPTEDLDFARLSQLAIAGGNIRNIALAGAFIAADAGGPLRMEHLLRAARSEYAKLERTLTDAELKGWS